VSLVSDKATVDVAQYLAKGSTREGVEVLPPLILDLMEMDNLIAGMLTQVAIHPDVVHVYRELLSSHGTEFYLDPPERYGIHPDDNIMMTFKDIGRLAREHGETVIGVKTADGNFALPPKQNATLKLAPGTQFLVIRDDDM